MSEFVPILGAAIILLVLSMIFVLVADQAGQGPVPYVPAKQPTYYAKGYTSTTILLDEEIVLKSDAVVVEEFSGHVSRSLLEDTRFERILTLDHNYSGASLEFYVSDANHLGSLIFSMDGEEIYRKVTERGDYSFQFNPMLFRDGKTFVVVAAPPAFYFWETTEYNFTARLKGLNLWESYYKFTADPSRDYTLYADIEEGWGWISVYLNNEIIYSGDPGNEEDDEDEQDQLTLKLPKDKVRNDNNLRITPHEGSYNKFSLIYIGSRKST